MSKFSDTFNYKYSDAENKSNIIQGDKFRITIIKERIIRFEYSETDNFTNQPTQSILKREFGDINYEVSEENNILKISTEYLLIYYNKNIFSKEGLKVIQKNSVDQDTIWRYGNVDKKNLKGTIKTLDNIDGKVELEDGLVSLNGYSIIDDSKSLIIEEDCSISERDEVTDIYYFGYGYEHRALLADFFKMSGEIQVLDKRVLGNWWSRFWEYSEDDVMNLVNKFEKSEIPISNFVFDMDWHLVDIPKECGSGWTGFTWNDKFFPDPKRILSYLDQKNINTVLNLHPADGFRYFEESYNNMCSDLNLDATKKEPIPFDVTNKKFMEAYFKHFIKLNEERGVGIWWMDWQQGSTCDLKNLDPLWLINHLHYVHAKNEGNVPIIFSRYGGIGSHRYPIGFSGDTHITWESLNFQPYFTANAANVGYNCWSHDIGGHMYGINDDELYLRWLQFGVFSPILRLHSGKTQFIEKEPWKKNLEVFNISKEFLQLRHRLIPYIYNEQFKCKQNFSQLIEPLYLRNGYDMRAYEHANEYYFGENIIVAPITTKLDEETNLAKVDLYLPKGKWYDLDGASYGGETSYSNYYTLDKYPIFVKESAIVILAQDYDNLNMKENNYEFMLTYGDGVEYLHDDEMLVAKIESKFSQDTCKVNIELYNNYQIDNIEFRVLGYSIMDVKNNGNEYVINIEKKSKNVRSMLLSKINSFNTQTRNKMFFEDILESNYNYEQVIIGEILSSNLTDKQKNVLISELRKVI